MIRRRFKLEELHNSAPNDKWAQKSPEDSFHRPFWSRCGIFIDVVYDNNSVISDSDHQQGSLAHISPGITKLFGLFVSPKVNGPKGEDWSI